ncbi:MAG: hypothetical protein MUO42_00265 [Anaerolineaceae bacterium]|nr:hypothetical protein [Anaerolineaceae bacterium]
MKKILPLLLFISLLINSCTKSELAAGWATPLPAQGDGDAYLHETKTAGAELTHATESPQPTEDARPLPKDWQIWPVVPEVTETAREIYKRGLALDNNPNTFSKVGDCQNLHNYFLGRFDHLEIYKFSWKIDDYLDTIENFKGSFGTDGQSAKFGFTAASPLSPLMADPEVCLPDEAPLECELRLTRPSFVLISLEFPFNGRSAGLYEQYLRQIIEYTISQGSVPILATKADNVEKDNSINLTIAKLAYEYNLPMWNWWAAAQLLGNHGIDPYRDGFHITQQAWEERSKTFLMALDHLWKGLKEIN